MSTKQKVRRLEKLGISDFETHSETQRLQTDLIGRLQHTAVAANEYKRLEACTTRSCGRGHCCDACWFGWRMRRLDLIPMVYDLFAAATGPIHEVHVARGHWVRPYGSLDKTSIAAAIKWNRWALDKVYNSDVIAVGMVKVAPADSGYGDVWVLEVNELVANVSKVDLERVLAGGRTATTFQNHWSARPVQNLGQAVSAVLRQDLRHWDIPGPTNPNSWPKKAL